MENIMKNRCKYCYALDIFGILALLGAALSLAAAISYAGTSLEATLFGAFRYALMGATAAFLVARMREIAGVFHQVPEVRQKSAVVALNSNETATNDPTQLPRAA